MGKIIIVGTLAFDTIETPHGKVERVIGGSAPFASLAAKTKNIECAIVSIVGNDFPKAYLNTLSKKNIDISEVKIKKNGKSFFWHGKYHENMNRRDTIETQVNVLANFTPSIPENYHQTDILVLGNLDPKVQLNIVEQFVTRPNFIILDTMNFWMDNSLDLLLTVISKVDLICINEEEVIQLSNCENIDQGVKQIIKMGPKFLVVKRGEYGATLYSKDNHFSCVTFKVKNVIDPTGAGDSFAGGFMGYLSTVNAYEEIEFKNACIYGTVMASLCVEDFGINKTVNLSEGEIENRRKLLLNQIKI